MKHFIKRSIQGVAAVVVIMAAYMLVLIALGRTFSGFGGAFSEM